MHSNFEGHHNKKTSPTAELPDQAFSSEVRDDMREVDDTEDSGSCQLRRTTLPQ
jgi:hypothetical protein